MPSKHEGCCWESGLKALDPFWGGCVWGDVWPLCVDVKLNKSGDSGFWLSSSPNLMNLKSFSVLKSRDIYWFSKSDNLHFWNFGNLEKWKS